MQEFVVIHNANWKVLSGEFLINTLYLCRSHNFVTYTPITYCDSIESAHMVATGLIRSIYREHCNEELEFIEQLLIPSHDINRIFDFIFFYNHSCFKIFQLSYLLYQ
jgi:hypothetical protein